jgi:6-pyruvoyltetrahydropterin/6-carboxytetrahydropterin synthase
VISRRGLALKRIVELIPAQPDHRCLNHLPALENPASERTAKCLFDGIAPLLPGLSAVTVWESDAPRCARRRR